MLKRQVKSIHFLRNNVFQLGVRLVNSAHLLPFNFRLRTSTGHLIFFLTDGLESASRGIIPDSSKLRCLHAAVSTHARSAKVTARRRLRHRLAVQAGRKITFDFCVAQEGLQTIGFLLIHFNHGVKAAELCVEISADGLDCFHNELNSGLKCKFVQCVVTEETIESEVSDLLDFFRAENQNSIGRSLPAVIV
jgi:hypothetical protein